jgi:hypothetical protein
VTGIAPKPVGTPLDTRMMGQRYQMTVVQMALFELEAVARVVGRTATTQHGSGMKKRAMRIVLRAMLIVLRSMLIVQQVIAIVVRSTLIVQRTIAIVVRSTDAVVVMLFPD